MPPRKARVETTNKQSSSKRKHDDNSSPGRPRLKKKQSLPREASPTFDIMNESTEATNCIDRHCWICHEERIDKSCFKCHRVYHNRCMRKSKQAFKSEICPQCQMESLDGTELSKHFLKMSQRMKKHLNYIVHHWNNKNPKLSFWEWPLHLGQNELTTIFDLQRLLDKIEHNHYTKPVQFYADAKYILHNCCILYKNEKDTTVITANRLLSYFREEVLSIEACLECCFPANYSPPYNEFRIVDPFFQICDPPHDLIWNKMKSFPYWPAKVIKVIGNTAHIKYFGDKHEKASVPLKDCYFLSKRHPSEAGSNQRNMADFSGPKSKLYKLARDELVKYINIYEKEYGTYPLDAFPAKTIYEPEKILHRKNPVREPEDDADCPPAPNESSSADNLKLKRISSLPCSAHPRVDIYSSGEDVVTIDEESAVVTTDSVRIDMTYTIDGSSEEPIPIDSGPAITSIGSLSAPLNAPSDRNINTSDGDGNLTENFNRLLVNVYERNGEVIGQRVSHSELDTMRGILHDFGPVTNPHPPVSAASMDDDDVIILDVPPASRSQVQGFNPDHILHYIRQINPELNTCIKESTAVFMSLMMRMWAVTNPFNGAPELLSKARSDAKKMKKELELSRSACETLQKEKTKALEEVQMYVSELDKVKARADEEISNRDQHMRNVAVIITGLQRQVREHLAQVNRLQIENHALLGANQSKDQEYQALNAKFESVQQQLAEMESNAALRDKPQTPQVTFDEESVIEHKTKDYCCICLKPAAFHCCLHTNYCSEGHQLSDEEHLKKCPNKKILEQGVSHVTHIKSQTITRARRSSFPGKLEVCIQRETTESQYITTAASSSKSTAEPMMKPPIRRASGKGRKSPRNRS